MRAEGEKEGLRADDYQQRFLGETEVHGPRQRDLVQLSFGEMGYFCDLSQF